MILFDLRDIGNRMFQIRKKEGLTQAEVAELSGLSDRTYAEIERGSVNMRLQSFLRICEALRVSPDEILTKEQEKAALRQEEVIERLSACPPNAKETALQLLTVYLKSLSS